MKPLLGIIIFLLSLSACKSQPNSKIWTEKYERGLYNYLDSTSKPSMPDAQKRLKYVTFYVNRVKEELPNGINSVSRDSVRNLNIRIGREYAVKENGKIDMVPYYTLWTPLVEKTYRNDLTVIGVDKGLKVTPKFCDCVIEELKKIYPDSILVPTPKEISARTFTDCKKHLGTN